MPAPKKNLFEDIQSKAGGSETNPLKSDPELRGLLKNVDKIKKYKTFQRWKTKFLDRLEQFLYEAGMKPAETAATDFGNLCKKHEKNTDKVQNFIQKGELSDTKKTVKGALALSEMCQSLNTIQESLSTLIPSKSQDEKKKGFTKFHLGAVLIRQGFYQYVSMKATADAVTEIGSTLQTVADRQQHDLFDYYKLQFERFCDVMADLDLYNVMMKCAEFQDAPEIEESTDEEPVIINISVETHDGKTIQLQLDPSDTIMNIKDAIADACQLPIDRQILKQGNQELTDNDKTLGALGIQDGEKLTVQPYKIPITVNTFDGKQIKLMVDPSEYLSDLKVQLQDESGLPAKNQRLFKDGEELADIMMKIEEHGITAGSVLDLEPKSIEIAVETPDGKTHTLRVNVSDTANDIKEKVSNATGMEVPRQVLKFQGKELPDGKPVKDMGIRDGSTLAVEVYRVPVTVNTLDGKQIKIMVDPSDYLSDIKIQLEGESGLPAKNQKLFMNGQELVDDMRKATDYGIKEGSVLDLEPKSMQIAVQTPDGKVHPIQVKATDTTEDIKAKVANATGMEVPRQVLMFQGNELPKCQTVKDMGIRDGSALTAEILRVPVTVNTMDGKKIEIMVDPCDYLSDIKVQLEDESGLPAANQKLFMNGTELPDDMKKASEYGIKEGSVLDLEPKSMQITVETPDGKVHSIDSNPSDTSDDIKAKVAKATGMAVPRQVLKFQGKELPNGKTIKDMGIRDGSALTADIFRVPVTVNTMDGKQIKVMVDPTDYLSDIKVHLEDDSDIPAKNQKLFMNGTELADDSKKASDYGIKEGSVLDLEPKSMQVTVATPDGKVHSIDVNPTDTSNDIKMKVAKASGITVPRQVLTFQGKELPHGQSAKDMGIRDGSALTAEIFRVPVTVNTMDGKQIKAMVDPTETLASIKNQLEAESDLPASNQKLSMNGKELEDDGKTAADYNIQEGSELDLEPKSMQISVQTPDGKVHPIDVTPDDTADDIKSKVAKVTGLGVPRQVLKHQGKELPNGGQSVKDMGIRDGSALTAEIFRVPVTVNTMDGKRINVMVDPTDTLANLKKQLEDESGLPAANQKLVMGGNELADDGKTAAEYGIKEGSELDLEPKSMQMSVTMPDGQVHSVDVTPHDTGDDIKRKIAKATGMAIPRQVLKHQGKELPNGQTAKDMGLRKGAALTVEVFRVPVTVKTMDGKQINIMVDPTDTLGAIKAHLEGQSDLPASNQKLSMYGKELGDDGKTAADYGIIEGSVLNLEPKSIQVTVQMPDGTSHAFQVKPSEITDMIKEKVAKASGMIVPRQVLKLKGKEVPKGYLIKDTDIREGSTLNVEVLRVPVTVKTMDGKHINAMVDPYEPVFDLKTQLEGESCIPAKNQRLRMFSDELVDDKSPVGDYGVKAGSVLDLEPKTIQVFVQMPDGKTHTVTASPSDKTEGFKQKVANATGMAVPRQVLKFQDRELISGRIIRELGVQDGSTMVLEIFILPVTVKTYDGQTLTLDVEPLDSIDSIKSMLHEQTGVEPKKQRLSMDDEELKNGRQTAEECGIKGGTILFLDLIADPIIFVDIKCGTLFAMERDVVIQKQALTPHQNNKIDFVEAAKDAATRTHIIDAMKASPTLGVATQVVVLSTEVEDYELEEAEKVQSVWGISLKKREKNKKGEEFFFVDPKTGAAGELSRKKFIEMKFITPAPGPRGNEILMETEKDGLLYDKYISDIRQVFGVKSAK